MRVLLLVLFVLASAAVDAAPPSRRLGEWDESQAHQVQRPGPKNRVHLYDDALPKNDPPFPWRAVGLMAIALAVAAPFGIWTWMQLANEMGAVTRDGRGSPPRD